MRIYGLTGGIASGKSSVARMLTELGASIVDADALARQVVEPGSDGLAAIVEHFGSGILLEDGSLDRKALGAIVFKDPAARDTLNQITHPRIAQAGSQAMAAYRDAGEELAFYEAALLVEKRLYEGMDGLIVVSLPRELQLRRLMERDGLELEDARARLEAQLPLEDKVAVADFVIDNSGSLDETRAQVEALWQRLRSQRE